MAFATDPKAGDDLPTGHRYNAACSAELAGCGQGEDAAKRDDQERARWRKQALDWLRADLALWIKQLENDKPEDCKRVQDTLRHWQGAPDLAGLRDAQALKQLPPGEQQVCQKLWADVAILLQPVNSPK